MAGTKPGTSKGERSVDPTGWRRRRLPHPRRARAVSEGRCLGLGACNSADGAEREARRGRPWGGRWPCKRTRWVRAQLRVHPATRLRRGSRGRPRLEPTLGGGVHVLAQRTLEQLAAHRVGLERQRVVVVRDGLLQVPEDVVRQPEPRVPRDRVRPHAHVVLEVDEGLLVLAEPAEHRGEVEEDAVVVLARLVAVRQRVVRGLEEMARAVEVALVAEGVDAHLVQRQRVARHQGVRLLEEAQRERRVADAQVLHADEHSNGGQAGEEGLPAAVGVEGLLALLQPRVVVAVGDPRRCELRVELRGAAEVPSRVVEGSDGEVVAPHGVRRQRG
mmetsp:Transcript_39900/g.123290  ORF Transcript_39900/g.123290 Transcript_39900/m.123290 type:complete len:331 (-) Transcript_39900:973-1965(-)